MNAMDTGGASRPEGQVGVRRQRALGDLSARKPETVLARMIRKLPQAFRTSVERSATDYLGRTFGMLSFRPTLHGVVYRPDWAHLTPEQILRLKVRLQARVDLTREQLAALQAEIFDWPTDVRDLARHFGGGIEDRGLLCAKLVTDAGVAFIVDAFQNSVELEILKYHGFGIGTTAESAAQTALVTELTTEYASDSTRPTGTTTEGASANIYRTVATLSPDSGGTIAITEHGVFSQAASGGTLLDRSKFSAVNLVSGSDSLQSTYELSLPSAG